MVYNDYQQGKEYQIYHDYQKTENHDYLSK